MNKKKIIIRADSSHLIGIGHIMRCLGLAEELRKNKFEVFFFTQKLKGNIADKIRVHKFETIILNAFNIKDDLNFVKKTMKEIGSDFIIIDNYNIGFEYEKELFDDSGVGILSLDGLHRKHFCHIFVNPNIYATAISCKKTVICKCNILSGYKYFILRDDFLKLKKLKKTKRADSKLQVLITLGGSDPDNRTFDILKTLHKIDCGEVKINVVIGPSNKSRGIIREFINYHWRCGGDAPVLYMDPSNMGELIKECDLCICAGGVTMGEALFFNKPIVGIPLVENQYKTIEVLSKKGVIFNAGTTNFSSNRLKSLICQILTKRNILKQMENKSKNLIDGRGRERIVKNILAAV